VAQEISYQADYGIPYIESVCIILHISSSNALKESLLASWLSAIDGNQFVCEQNYWEILEMKKQFANGTQNVRARIMELIEGIGDFL
jgi:hypothetical protein